MTPERWKRIEELFHAASALPPDAHRAFLAAACPDDERLQGDVEALLNESASEDGFLAGRAVVTASQFVVDASPGAMTGRSLGGYHLQALLGAGGMGEVYRSRDAKLGRDVAIKILPRAFTSDPDRLARFEREARMLAALNHPGICAIYGFEEADGVRFLVLELVEGETLAARIASARMRSDEAGLSIPEALAIARQIAEALEVAHDKGIIHRDLKPANVTITPDGLVKVLDFGLAKVVGGDGATPDITHVPLAPEAGGREGAVIGTAAYMSPEQARGQPVDKRSDIWSFGCVLYEMLAGRVTFAGDTMSDSIAKILEREPDWTALPAATSAPIRRLLLRCLAKDPKQRLRDIGDARIELASTHDVLPATPDVQGARAAPAKAWLKWQPWVALMALAAALVAWEAWRSEPIEVAGNPLANATFARVTDWDGTEEQADISPDGRFVTFVADKAGEFDVWVSQVGTGRFQNLTLDGPPMVTPANLLRSLGFNGDGSEIWFNPVGNPGREKVLVPLTGGTSRPFLRRGYSTPSWSPDNARLALIHSDAHGDPLYLADRIGANPHTVNVLPQDTQPFFREGRHTHNPVWSPDGEWIYFVHGTGPTGRMDVWRVKPSGASPEQLTARHADVNFLAPLDLRTLLYVARGEDWSGPWLWALDVESKVTRRVTVGLEQYTSVSASRDGRRVVAAVAKPTASLWRIPLNDRAGDVDAQPFPVPTERALAPRHSGASLFYLSLSTRGTGDGLWRFHNGEVFEVTKGADNVLSEPPVVSPDGTRVAIVARQLGTRQLAIMSADGTNSRTLAPSIEIHGVVGQGAADWSPDGSWLVAAGSDATAPGLFRIPVDGSAPVRLVEGWA